MSNMVRLHTVLKVDRKPMVDQTIRAIATFASSLVLKMRVETTLPLDLSRSNGARLMTPYGL